MSRIADPDQAHAAALLVAAQREVMASIRQDEHDRAVLYARMLRNRGDLYRMLDRRPADAILELAGAARIGQTKALTQLQDGWRMLELYPLGLELLEAGALLVGTVEMLLLMTRPCAEHVQLELGRRILGQLVGMDAAHARALIKATIGEVEADLDLQAQKDRHAQAEANRGVWVKPVEDGMARIGAEFDELKAQRFALDLDELARAQKALYDRTGRQCTMQQCRADVLAELPSRHLELLQAFQRGKTLADLLPEGIPLPRTSSENGAADSAAATACDQADTDALFPIEPSLCATGGADAPTKPPSTSTSTSTTTSAPADARGLAVSEVAALLFALPVRNPVTMYVHTPMTTLLDLDNRSGYVEGLGAITAHRARLLRPIASLQRLWVDASTGVPIDIDPHVDPPIGEPDWTKPDESAAAATQVRDRLLHMLRPTGIDQRAEPNRKPSTALTRLIQARDLGCDGPGCPTRARRCELDHEHDWALGGLTAEWNLKARSPRCHHCKHAGWRVLRHPDGSTTWISALGSTYTRRSPWPIPPAGPTGELPPPTLDRPDGGKSPSDWLADPALDRSLDSRLGERQPRPADPDPTKRNPLRPPPKDLPEDKPLNSGWDPPPF